MKFNKLTKEEEQIIVNRGTEPPGTGEYDKFFKEGTYICRRCNTHLYNSKDKFDANCGWPAFDDEIPGAVKRVPDPDGKRTEIECAKCGGHLGHVFTGERLTEKNVRHCVNSLSMKFIPAASEKDDKKKENREIDRKNEIETIVFGAGCFWCTEAVFSKLNGVLSVLPGYAGGTTKNPTYYSVCSGKTGHAEVLQVEYNPGLIAIERLLDLFFSMHDPTDSHGQGNDKGSQYRSMILYTSEKQRLAIEHAMNNLQAEVKKPIITEVAKLKEFYPAEENHQEYFKKNPLQPYCLLVIRPKLAKLKKKLDE